MPNPALGLVSMLLLGAAGAASAAPECAVRSTPTVTPLVDLYTSEGCSSCPPADRWLRAQVGRTDSNFLAYHVDYWDSIGWPDRFASPAYTQRQRTRVAQAAGGSAIFTPQVMVGSQVQAHWRSTGRFDRLLQRSRLPSPVALALQARPNGGAWEASIGAARSAGAASGPARIWLAQYVDGQSTQVRAGENHGVTLRHDRVVKTLLGPWTLGDAAFSRVVTVPAQTGHWGLTLLAQDDHGGTLQSLSLASDRCASAVRSASIVP